MDGPNLITRRKLWAFIDISQNLWVLREIIPAIFSSSESEPLGNKFLFLHRGGAFIHVRRLLQVTFDSFLSFSLSIRQPPFPSY